MTTLQIRHRARIREGHRRRAAPRTRRRGEAGLWPSSTGLLAAYCAAAAVTAGTVLAGATRHPAIALGVLAATVLIIATGTTPAVALTAAGIAWMFDDGFIIGRHAQLAWRGADDGWRLMILAGAALAGVLLSRALASRSARSPGPRSRVPAATTPSAHLMRPATTRHPRVRRAAVRQKALTGLEASHPATSWTRQASHGQNRHGTCGAGVASLPEVRNHRAA